MPVSVVTSACATSSTAASPPAPPLHAQTREAPAARSAPVTAHEKGCLRKVGWLGGEVFILPRSSARAVPPLHTRKPARIGGGRPVGCPIEQPRRPVGCPIEQSGRPGGAARRAGDARGDLHGGGAAAGGARGRGAGGGAAPSTLAEVRRGARRGRGRALPAPRWPGCARAVSEEWAYAGFAITLGSALIAHLSLGDGPEAWGWSAGSSVLWGISYFLWRRLEATPASA